MRKTINGASVLALLLLLLLAMTATAPVMAQVLVPGTPTPTPNDPIWRAFSAVRDAIELEKKVDLTTVRNYEWEQAEWKGGIDDCTALVTEDPASARKLYFGWVFTVTSLTGQIFQGRSSFDTTIIVVCDQVVTAATVPTPLPGTPVAGLPTPIPGSAAAGGFEIGGHVLAMSPNTFSLMQRAGMRWVKVQVRHNPGTSTDQAANYINTAKANGYKILIGLLGSKDALGANFDGYTAEYSQFAAAVAALGPDAIEVWNEPNIDREWPAGQVSGANYTRLLAATYNAIKGRNASVLVISGAPAPTGFFGAAGCTAQGCNDDTFMQQMAQSGAAQYMDCVGLHYNEGILSPSAGSGDPRGSYPTYYFGSMLQRGYGPFGGKPVCWTELGYVTPQGYSTPLSAGFAWGQNTTVAQQAAWLAEAATLSAQSGRVRLMIVWNVDFPSPAGDDPQGKYAMLRPDGSCPACDTLGAVMRR